jgi:type IV secretion system protein VirB10
MSTEQNEGGATGGGRDSDNLSPLPGERGIPSVYSAKKASVALKAVLGALVVVVAMTVAGYALIARMSRPDPAKAEAKAARAGPQVAMGNVSRKQFGASRPEGAAAEPTASNVASPTVPALDAETADPIGLKGSTGRSGQPAPRRPEDAPAVLELTSDRENQGSAPSYDASAATGSPSEELSQAQANLAQYQQQLHGMVDQLQHLSKPGVAAGGLSQQPANPAAPTMEVAQRGTARISAGTLGDRSLTLPRGTTFTCALKTKIISELSDPATCQVLRNVYSDDDRVLLIERGSHLDGEYSAHVNQGQTRVAMIWSRLRLPNGVTVDLESPGTGPLGEAGVGGYVDNHWGQRIGGALLLTFIDDAVKIAVAEAAARNNSTSVIVGGQSDATSQIASQVLANTINIPPTIYKLQGESVGIYVAKDVDFSSVYELRTAAR